MMLRDVLPAAMIATACAVATIVFVSRREPPRAAIAHTRSDAVVLDGLRAGDRVAGWDVVAIETTADGGLDVVVARGGIEFVLGVVPLGVRPENPPFSSPTHAIYYGHARPAGAQIPAGALRAITADLLRRLERSDHAVGHR